MLSLFRPTDAALAALRERDRAADFTYPHVGHTRDGPAAPAGYDDDHNRVRLGSGAAVFAAATAAVRAWAMFPPGWTRVVPAGAPVEAGQVVVVVARVLGLWWTNVARVVYAIDEPRRFGFAYGTLPGHVEQGEERFLVEWHDDDSVWYDLRAFSRPRYWLARLGYPVVRLMQRAFARDSLRAMVAAARTST